MSPQVGVGTGIKMTAWIILEREDMTMEAAAAEYLANHPDNRIIETDLVGRRFKVGEGELEWR